MSSTKAQLDMLSKQISGFPNSSEDQAAWIRARSRSSFRPDSPFPPVPAIPLSSASASVKIFWRDFNWNREAPARLLPGLLRILEQSSGRLRSFCLHSIQYFRIKHSRSFRPGFATVPPFSALERKFQPLIFFRQGPPS